MSLEALRHRKFSQNSKNARRVEFMSQSQRVVPASVSAMTEHVIFYDSQLTSMRPSLYRRTEISATLNDSFTTIWMNYGEPTQKFPKERHLEQVQSGNSRVVFDRGLGLRVEITCLDDRYSVTDNKFGIYGFGASEEEARLDYEEFFVKFFRDIIETPESQLAPSTLEYKQTLQAFGTLVTDE